MGGGSTFQTETPVELAITHSIYKRKRHLWNFWRRDEKAFAELWLLFPLLETATLFGLVLLWEQAQPLDFSIAVGFRCFVP